MEGFLTVIRSDVVGGQLTQELRLYVEVLRNPRACLLSLLSFAVGVGYLFGPIDLIPDKTPYVGHLDEVTMLLGGAALARWLVPSEVSSRLSRGDWPAGAGEFRRPFLRTITALAGRSIFRLSLGRWPTAREHSLFSSGFVDDSSKLAPILRGLHSVPAAKEQLGRLALLNLVREGCLPEPPSGAREAANATVLGNPLSFHTKQPIAFLHLEKTAGTALVSVLTEMCHPLQIDDDPYRSMPPHVRSPFVGRGAEDARRSKLIWGHYDLPSLRRVDPVRAVITLLREPRERLLSLYHYWRSVDASRVGGAFGNFNVAAAHDHDLLDFLTLRDPLVRDYVDNFYVRRLTGLYHTGRDLDPVEEDPGEALACAEAALDTIEFVGILERLEESLWLLSSVIDLPMPVRLPQLNKSDANHREASPRFRHVLHEKVTPEIERELDRVTRLDHIIYSRARRNLQCRVGPNLIA